MERNLVRCWDIAIATPGKRLQRLLLPSHPEIWRYSDCVRLAWVLDYSYNYNVSYMMNSEHVSPPPYYIEGPVPVISGKKFYWDFT